MRRLFRPFVLILTLLLALFYVYLGFRLAAGWLAWLSLFLPFAAVWSVPVIFWSSDREDSTLLMAFLQWFSFLSMGYLSFLLLATLLRDLLIWPLAKWEVPALRPAFSSAGNTGVVALAFIVLFWGVFRAFSGPRIRRVEISIEGLDPALADFKIAQLSDLHVGPTIRRKYVEKVVRLTNSLQADLVALTGDFADGTVHDLSSELEPLAGLLPAQRIFYVPGNHEYYWDGSGWIAELRKLGAVPLLNTGTKIEHRGASVYVAGVLDPAASMESAGAGPDPAAAAQGADERALMILLAHHPKIASEAAKAGFDLQLSGHTHGGQFWPWIWVARRVHRELLQGLTRFGKMWVYINVGTGTWGPPVRFGTSPEITLLRLRPFS